MFNQTSGYLANLSQVFSFIYLNFGVPIAIFLVFYILGIYCWNMILGTEQENIIPQTRLRRGVATIFPFLLSLYSIVISEAVKISSLPKWPLYVAFEFFAGSMLVGFIFIYWIGRVRSDNELASTLSCFVASMIFFLLLTSFVITQSVEILSCAFGFLSGICIYVIRYGLSDIGRFRFPRPKVPGFLGRLFRRQRKSEPSDAVQETSPSLSSSSDGDVIPSPGVGG